MKSVSKFYQHKQADLSYFMFNLILVQYSLSDLWISPSSASLSRLKEVWQTNRRAWFIAL